MHSYYRDILQPVACEISQSSVDWESYSFCGYFGICCLTMLNPPPLFIHLSPRSVHGWTHTVSAHYVHHFVIKSHDVCTQFRIRYMCAVSFYGLTSICLLYLFYELLILSTFLHCMSYHLYVLHCVLILVYLLYILYLVPGRTIATTWSGANVSVICKTDLK